MVNCIAPETSIIRGNSVTDEPPYLVRIGQLQEEVGKLVYYSLPEKGWDTCTLEYRKAGPVGESLLTCTFSDGRTESLEVPMAIIRALKELRHEMASQGKGAWLSSSVTVNNSGHMKFSFNYDERPKWLAPVEDDVYVDDLKKYPRPPEAIPGWYRELIGK